VGYGTGVIAICGKQSASVIIYAVILSAVGLTHTLRGSARGAVGCCRRTSIQISSATYETEVFVPLFFPGSYPRGDAQSYWGAARVAGSAGAQPSPCCGLQAGALVSC